MVAIFKRQDNVAVPADITAFYALGVGADIDFIRMPDKPDWRQVRATVRSYVAESDILLAFQFVYDI
jgi:hypothetical protein